jgi:hypothetical protein
VAIQRVFVSIWLQLAALLATKPWDFTFMPLCSFRNSLSAQPMSKNDHSNDSKEEIATSPVKNLRLAFNATPPRRDFIGRMMILFWSAIGLGITFASTLLAQVNTRGTSRLCYQPILLSSREDGS